MNISPRLDYVSITNENSTIYVYKLKDLNQDENEFNVDVDEIKQTQQHFNKNSRKLFTNGNQLHEFVGGHSNIVYKSKFTHDSKYLLSCGADSIVSLWDVNTDYLNLWSHDSTYQKTCSPLICKYNGHLYSVFDIDIYSHLNSFVTCSKDKTARLWSFDRVFPLRVYSGHQSDVNCVTFHPNGSYIATGSSDKTVRFYSVHSGECLRLFYGHTGRVYSVCFSPDGQYLASAGEDKIIKLWDIKTGKLLKELKNHTDTVYSLEFDNSSTFLCSGSSDKTLKFWNFNAKDDSIPVINIKSEPIEMSNGESKHETLSPSSSNELLNSINVNFTISTLYCDLQNVFYALGMKKKTNETIQDNDNEAVNIGKNDDCSTKIKKKIISNDAPLSFSNNNQNFTNNPINSSSSQISQISTRRRTLANDQQNTSNTSTTANMDNQSITNLFNNHEDLYEI